MHRLLDKWNKDEAVFDRVDALSLNIYSNGQWYAIEVQDGAISLRPLTQEEIDARKE